MIYKDSCNIFNSDVLFQLRILSICFRNMSSAEITVMNLFNPEPLEIGVLPDVCQSRSKTYFLKRPWI